MTLKTRGDRNKNQVTGKENHVTGCLELSRKNQMTGGWNSAVGLMPSQDDDDVNRRYLLFSSLILSFQSLAFLHPTIHLSRYPTSPYPTQYPDMLLKIGTPLLILALLPALAVVVADDVKEKDIFQDLENLPFASEAPPVCPPPFFKAKTNFNLDAYVQGRWYIQEQQPIRYLEADSNYCVTARYEKGEPSSVSSNFFLQPLLSWLRYAPGEIRSMYPE